MLKEIGVVLCKDGLESHPYTKIAQEESLQAQKNGEHHHGYEKLVEPENTIPLSHLPISTEGKMIDARVLLSIPFCLFFHIT